MTEINGWYVRDDTQPQDWWVIQESYYIDTYLVKHITLDPEPIVLDVGACIGSFSRLILDRHPKAKVLAIEVNPKNYDAIRRNTPKAILVPAALHYGNAADLALLDAVFPGTNSTGGSVVLTRSEVESCTDPQYRKSYDPIVTVTIERLMDEFGLDHIDLIKMDCEGSEYSILGGISREAASRVKMMVGEYHGGYPRFYKAVGDFSGRTAITWKFEPWAVGGDRGMFRLTRHEVHALPGQ